MTPFESLACLCLFILSVYVVLTTSSTYIRGTANVAPHARGLPLVGGTLSLALLGADFIHTCRKRVRMKQWVASVSGHSRLTSPQCCLQYGDIVRVSLGGQCMTYLFGPDAVKLFFSASDDQIGFRQAIPSPSSQCCCCDINVTCNPGRPATEHFTGRVFGLPSHLFFPHHTALLQGLRAQLTPAKLPSHGHALLSSMKLESDRVLTSSGKVTCWLAYCIC